MRNDRDKRKSPIGRHTVPDCLRGKNNSIIKSWAREILLGEEPDLSADVLRRIRDGELREVYLRPKRKGFYTDEGVFIEAFDYSPEFGEDLDEAEKKWDVEEKEREWIDEENRVFNQTIVRLSARPTVEYWEHGKRISEYIGRSGRPAYSVQRKLAERGREDGYGLYTHQFCTDFYLWKRKAAQNDLIFTLTWGDIDCIMKFSREDAERECCLEMMLSLVIQYRLTSGQLCCLLGVKNQDRLSSICAEEWDSLNQFRASVRAGTWNDENLLAAITLIAGKVALPRVQDMMRQD